MNFYYYLLSGKAIRLAVCFLFLSLTSFSQIYINEFQSSNDSYVPEMYDFSDFPDWIELYNAGTTSVNLQGYTITDDTTISGKWTFPAGTYISAGGFLRLWADGFDAEPGMWFEREWEFAGSFVTKYYHIPFKLKKDGEEIALYDDDGNMLDHIVFGPQVTDVSYGRKPDGSNNWFYFGDATPEASNSTQGYTSTTTSKAADITPAGGFYNSTVIANAGSINDAAILRYTNDGSVPMEMADVLTDEVEVASSTTLRVRSFEPDLLPSYPETELYNFDDKNITIPIISISTDPDLLWDEEFGIYENELKQRDIPIKFEYFLDKETKVLSTYAELKLSGQYSYQYPQKPFTISAGSALGDDYLSYPFYANVNNRDFESIYLRNSGWPDINHTFFRDALTHTIVYNQMDLDAQSYQPAATYLNGEFWGVYNIREKLNTNYFQYHHDADPDNIDMLEYDDYSTFGPLIVCEGSDTAYQSFLNYLENNDLSYKDTYAYVKSQMDIDEYINFMITEIFVDNHNWMYCNMKWWRERKEGAKWRWILLDTDDAFGMASDASSNMLEYALSGNDWDTFLFRKMHENGGFKNEFAQRFAAYLNTTFRSERTVAIIDSLENNLLGTMPYHINKWQSKGRVDSVLGAPNKDMGSWQSSVQVMRSFAEERPEAQRTHLKNYYNISDVLTHSITKTGGQGKIFAQGVYLPEECLTGEYFSGIPLRLKAIAAPGYTFVEWEGVSSQNEINLTLTEDTQLTAVFAPSSECMVLSEITEDLILDNACEYYLATDDIVVAENTTLEINEGVEIRMPQDASIKVKGRLIINGTEDQPVVVTFNENVEAQNWGGICFDNSTAASEINYLELHGASKVDNNLFIGAISAHKADVTLNNVSVGGVHKPFYSEYGNIIINQCNFSSPYTCDYINVKYASSAIIENSTFIGNKAADTDAIDIDASNNAIVRNNVIKNFKGFNSDGIDLGENCSNVLIEGNYIYNVSDKAISVGQGSKCTIRRNVIIGNVLGIGIKDFGSYAMVDQNTFYGNETAIACYEKNVGFGGGSADVVNSILSRSVLSATFVDDLSSLNVSYSLIHPDTIVGEGNIMEKPLFVEEAIFNLELQAASPCINAGDPSSPLDGDNSRADIGAYYTDTNTQSELTLVVNEINYNSVEEYNAGDWFELYNNSDATIDLSEYTFMDKNFGNKFKLDSIVMEPDSYFVLVNDSVSFSAIYPDVENYRGTFPFGLGSGGDIIRIFNKEMAIVDGVQYNDKLPWPEAADGQGPTLELISPDYDNAKAENWFAFEEEYGTPGAENHMYVSTGVVNVEKIAVAASPNPFKHETYINISSDNSINNGIIEIYNVCGKRLKTISNINSSKIYFNRGSLANGVYIFKFINEQNKIMATNKLILY